jgi:hypothetical protein
VARSTVWVAHLDISPNVEQKLRHKHHLEPQDVRDAIECVEGLPYVWDDSPLYGERMILNFVVKGVHLMGSLVPVVMDAYGDRYLLLTAYPKTARSWQNGAHGVPRTYATSGPCGRAAGIAPGGVQPRREAQNGAAHPAPGGGARGGICRIPDAHVRKSHRHTAGMGRRSS